MSEVEKQESQKTVVAFITGLLIGGLLVWVFSSSNDDKMMPEESKKADAEKVEKTDEKKDGKMEDKKDADAKPMVGKGSIEVADQKAGMMVTLGALEFPAETGWVAVRDSKDGVLGNVIGASFYDVERGIVPKEIEVVRPTISGSSYNVSFYSNEGAIAFSSTEDKMVEGVAATFKAE